MVTYNENTKQITLFLTAKLWTQHITQVPKKNNKRIKCLKFQLKKKLFDFRDSDEDEYVQPSA